MDKTSLGDRMKTYEKASRVYLTRRMPLIIRLDGKAFHTLTKKLEKPYDKQFKGVMASVAKDLVDNIMGCKFAYVQSDEISLMLTDYDKLETCAWFDKQLQKLVSVSASMATAYFNKYYIELIDEEKRKVPFGFFDARAFVLPKEEVCNYLIFRQNDATRNSIQGLGQKYFSHKELHGKSCDKIQDMLMVEKGINWNDIEPYFKRGGFVYKQECDTELDENTPVFTKDRKYVEEFVNISDLDSINRKMRGRASSILDGVDELDNSEKAIQSLGTVNIFEKSTDNKEENYESGI